MALKNTMDNNLAKANIEIEFFIPPSEDGGNSDGGNLLNFIKMNRNVALAHSDNEIHQNE